MLVPACEGRRRHLFDRRHDICVRSSAVPAVILEWLEHVACRGGNQVMFAYDEAETVEDRAIALKEARTICERCPHRIECGELSM